MGLVVVIGFVGYKHAAPLELPCGRSLPRTFLNSMAVGSALGRISVAPLGLSSSVSIGVHPWLTACSAEIHWLEFHFVGLSNGLVGELAVHDVDAAGQCGIKAARFGQPVIGQQFDVAVSDVGQGLGGGAG